jgi:hypothetical protein
LLKFKSTLFRKSIKHIAIYFLRKVFTTLAKYSIMESKASPSVSEFYHPRTIKHILAIASSAFCWDGRGEVTLQIRCTAQAIITNRSKVVSSLLLQKKKKSIILLFKVRFQLRKFYSLCLDLLKANVILGEKFPHRIKKINRNRKHKTQKYTSKILCVLHRTIK